MPETGPSVVVGWSGTMKLSPILPSTTISHENSRKMLGALHPKLASISSVKNMREVLIGCEIGHSSGPGFRVKALPLKLN